LGILGVYYFSQTKSDYDLSKETDLGLSSYATLFDKCKAVIDIPMANRSEEMRLCPAIPSENNLLKLSLIKDLKGVIVENTALESMSVVWNFEFETKNTVGKTVFTKIVIYQKGNNKYLSIGGGSPPFLKMAQVRISADILSKLREPDSNPVRQGSYLTDSNLSLKCTIQMINNTDLGYYAIVDFYDSSNNLIGNCKLPRGPVSLGCGAGGDCSSAELLTEPIKEERCKGMIYQKYICSETP
jgi:hypothetical protein